MVNEQVKLSFLLQSIVDTAFEAMSLLNRDGRILYENTGMHELLGYHPEERMDKYFASFFFRKEEPEFNKLIRTSGYSTTFTCNIFHNDGYYIKINLRGSYVKIPGFEDVVIIGAKKDEISTLREISILNDTLQKAEEIGLQGSYKWDIDSGKLTLSKGWQRVHGTEGISISLANLMQIVHPEDAGRVKKALDDAIHNHQNYSIEHRIIRYNDKQERTVRSAANVYFDSKGMPQKMVGFVQDITGQKEYEESLKASEAFYREILHSINDTVLLTDFHGNVTYICPNLHFIFGILEEESQQIKTVAELLGKEFEINTKVFVNHGLENAELQVTNKMGEKKDVLISAKALSFKSQTLLFTIHDVTGLNKIKRALKDSLLDLQLAQEISSIGNWQLSPESHIPFWSPEIYKIYERAPEKGPLHVSDYKAIFPPNQYAVFKEAIQQAREHGKAYNITLHFTGKRGRQKWIRSICRPEKVSDHKYYFLRGTIQDITKEMQVSKALKESERRYKLLAQNSTDIIALFQNENMMYISPSVKKILGYTSEELLEMDLTTLFHPEEYEQMMEKLLKPLKQEVASPSKHIYRQKHKQGHYIWLETFSTYQKQDDGVLLTVANSRDITDRVMAEQELVNHEQALMELNATKDKLFSIISHDLRSPFNAILGFSNLLLNAIKKEDYKKLADYSVFIRDSAQQTYNLLENLLNWSRLQSNKIQFHPQRVKIKGMIDNAIAVLGGNAEEKLITIKVDAPDKGEIMADPLMLEIILRNLLSNAIKFTPQKGRIIIKSFIDQKLCYFTITDTGVGMEKEFMKSIFDFGEETSRMGTNNEKGAGLGLMLCKEFVERHGGEIWVSSELNKGTTFTFTLPVMP